MALVYSADGARVNNAIIYENKPRKNADNNHETQKPLYKQYIM